MYGEDDRDRPTLRDYFPWMRPIAQVPTVFQVLGTGLTMVGRRHPHDETNSYVAAHCLTVLFVPVLALGAYRVQDSPRGGWYFLGTESMRVLSWCGNLLFVLLFLGLIGAGVWFLRTGSGEYRDGTRLAKAQVLIDEGQRGEAAKVLELILEGKTSHVPAAREKLAGLVLNPAQEAQDVAAWEVAALQDRKGEPVVPDLFKKGYQAADLLGAKDPVAGLRLLDIVSPLALDQTEALQLERRLIEPLVKKDPNDVALVSRLASAMSALGEPNATVRAMLLPHEDKLDTLDGAAILGGLYADEGNYPRATKLLVPYVERRIPGYRDANRNLEVARKAVIDRVSQQIWAGTAPGFDKVKFNAANEEQKQAMFAAYVWPLVLDDVAFRLAGSALNRERLTMQAVLNLGLAELHLAQAEADPAKRRAGLENAERTFLKVRDQANTSPMYRTQLARVYYWLGKPAEGRQLLDVLMDQQKRSPEIVSMVAGLLRSVGAITEGRRLVEEAYGKEASKEGKQDLANMRSMMPLDLDDRILWLGRANLEDSETKASLASSLGHRAMRNGKDAEAAKHYREGIAIYAEMAENSTTLNNGAICWFGLYDATYDLEAYREGRRRIDKAAVLEPTSPILLMHHVGALLTGASADAIGPAIDCKVLRRRPGLDLLPYLYLDAAGRDKVVARLRASPDLAQARATLERLTVLAPGNPNVYSQLASVLEVLDDKPALEALAAKVEGQELDTGDAERMSREYFEGKKDAQRRDESRAAVARSEQVMEDARKVKGATLAAAACRVSAQIQTLSFYEKVDDDRALKLAEEGHAAAASDATRSVLLGARLGRAVRTLKKEPAFAEAARAGERSLGSWLVAWALVGGGVPRDKALGLDDVKEAVKLKLAQVEALPQSRGPLAWALLSGSHPEGERVAARLRGDRAEAAKLRIDARTSPLGGVTAAEQAWLLRIEGKDVEAKALLDGRAAKGVPLPVWGR